MSNVGESHKAADRRATILAVDDDPNITALLSEVLSDTYSVRTASDGREAWEMIQADPSAFDFVIADIHMPEVDGITLLSLIRKHHPEIGVMMISGTTDVRLAVQALRQGAYDYMVKPFVGLEEMEIIIERYFERQRLENRLAEYVRLHEEMMRHMKVRTFLSLDVVGSTKMKAQEDPFLVQFSFMQYHHLVREKIEAHHGMIHSTAGDGVMCCFASAQDAVDTGISIYRALPEFNRDKNRLAMPFRVRSGVHTGPAIIGEDGQISDMFASTLDITGHIQKYGEAGKLVISLDTYNAISNTDDFEPTGRDVDGVPTYVYRDSENVRND